MDSTDRGWLASFTAHEEDVVAFNELPSVEDFQLLFPDNNTTSMMVSMNCAPLHMAPANMT